MRSSLNDSLCGCLAQRLDEAHDLLLGIAGTQVVLRLESQATGMVTTVTCTRKMAPNSSNPALQDHSKLPNQGRSAHVVLVVLCTFWRDHLFDAFPCSLPTSFSSTTRVSPIPYEQRARSPRPYEQGSDFIGGLVGGEMVRWQQ